jgi:hypothetical protein
MQKKGKSFMRNLVKTAYSDLKHFVYGKALSPVKCRNGVEIGGGDVYPELNFTKTEKSPHGRAI